MILGIALYKYAKWKKILAITTFLITIITLSVISFLALSPAKAAPGDTGSFITTWKTDNPGTSNNSSMTIGTAGFGYLYNVDWDNDGTFDEFGLTDRTTHDFGTPGTYTIRIQGTFPRFVAQSGGDAKKLVDVNQWGANHWESMNIAFAETTNMTVSATDTPDLSGVTNASGMFANAAVFNSPVSSWNTSNITNMQNMFKGAKVFNQDLSSWDVSKVASMTGMFSETDAFNSDISTWNTSSVTSMADMFNNALTFNKPIGAWDVSNVSSFDGMFYRAAAFNQPLGNWNTASSVLMGAMFAEAAEFNQDLPLWNTSHVTDMSNMFRQAVKFNGDISTWNVSSATNMNSMFAEANTFNGTIGGWDVSNVTNAGSMFSGAAVFNKDLGAWNTHSLENAQGMFDGASSFNYSLGSFDMSNVIYATNMFARSGLSIANTDQTLRLWATQDVQVNVALGAVSYCTAKDSVAHLTDTFNWTIYSTVSCGALLSNGSIVNVANGTASGTDIGTLTVTNFSLRTANPYELSCTQPGADDALFEVGGADKDRLVTKSSLDYSNPLDQGQNNRYEVCIRSLGADGYGFDTMFEVTVAPPKLISGATFGSMSAKKTLTITGSALLSGSEDYSTALDHSMVRLNGQDLKFCADGFNMTAQQMIDAFSGFYPKIAQNITDNPPCYFIVINGYPALDATSATIWLPDNFDITTRGTVSVNNSPVYTFNPNAGGGDVEPTVDVNGNKDIDANPTIPTLPTFTGIAEPGATVTVTVHSDPVTCTTTADQDGRWSCTLSTALPAGAHTVFVQITNPDSSVVELGPYSVVVEGAGGGVIDNNTPLAPNTGFLAKHAEILKGMKQKEIIGISAFLVTGALIGLFVGTGSLAVYRRLKN